MAGAVDLSGLKARVDAKAAQQARAAAAPQADGAGAPAAAASDPMTAAMACDCSLYDAVNSTTTS